MATQAALRERTQRLVYSSLPFLRPYRDALSSSITSGTTTFTVTNEDDWDVGDILVFQDTGEECVVTAVTSNDTNQITVRRGAFGTTAASHSSGVEFEKNPRFTVRELDDAIQHSLENLWPRVYVLATGSFTFSANTFWYPISDNNCREVLSVYYEDPTYLTPRPITVWRFNTGLDSAEFSQQQGLYIPTAQGMNEGETVYYTYRKELTNVADLKVRQERLVVLGAVAALLAAEEVARTYDPGRMTDRTVQPGQNIRDASWFYQMWLREVRQEELRLKQEESRLPKTRVAERRRRWTP